jgi:thiamine biosynthesis lipoprotein
VLGTPFDDTSWYLGIEDPTRAPHHAALLRVRTGGIATSGTTVHRWRTGVGGTAHHLIDPQRGAPCDTALLSATVLAADGATAEAFATAAMMSTGEAAVAMLDGVGLAGLTVAEDGTVLRTATLEEFLA